MDWQIIYDAVIKALSGVSYFATAVEKGALFVGFVRKWRAGKKQGDEEEARELADRHPSGASGRDLGAMIEHLFAAREQVDNDQQRELDELRETVNRLQRQLGAANARSVILVAQVGELRENLRETVNGFELRFGEDERVTNGLRETVNGLQRRFGAPLPSRRVDGVRCRTTTGSSNASSNHAHDE